MYVTTLQLPCTSEYTLTAMDTGTYSVAVVPVLQGAIPVLPNAETPIVETDGGILTEVKSQPINAINAMVASVVLISMSPEQHAADGVVLSTQSVVAPA